MAQICLLMTGSFSPIHIGHLSSAALAAERVEAEGFQVTKIIFSPSHDSYLSRKLSGGRRPLSGDERILLMEKAIESSEDLKKKWFCVVDRTELDADDFIEHVDVRRMVEEREGVPVVFVAGADLARSMGGWSDDFPVVVVSRDDGTTRITKNGRIVAVHTLNGSALISKPFFVEDKSNMRFIVEQKETGKATASSTAVASGELSFLPPSIIALYNSMINGK